jgi:hypothetical protein
VLEDFDKQKLQQQQQLAEGSIECYEKLSKLLRAAAAQATMRVQQLQQLECCVHPVVYLQSDEDKVNEGCIARSLPNHAAAATFSKAAAERLLNFSFDEVVC